MDCNISYTRNICVKLISANCYTIKMLVSNKSNSQDITQWRFVFKIEINLEEFIYNKLTYKHSTSQILFSLVNILTLNYHLSRTNIYVFYISGISYGLVVTCFLTFNR